MEKFLYTRIEKTPKINVWFAFPAIESFAMASVGYLSIFKMLDLDSELYVERIYQDTKTTQVPLDYVHTMGFSMSFEIDILNIIKMLKKYNIPLKSKDRNENHPIIFAGGPVLMSNPKPYEEFFDFISIGEMNCLKPAMEILKKKNEKTRDEILKELSFVDGIYVPKFPKPTKITRDDLEKEIFSTPVLSDKSYFKDTFVIEIERGCPKMCNFCLASWLNIPVRFVQYEKIIETIELGLQYTNKIALLGAYVAGHPDFSRIVDYISKKIDDGYDIELSISSLRADWVDDKLIQTLVKCKQKTATIALEAGSQRLRNLIQKDLTDEEILNTIHIAQKNGLKGLKIYTMLGLPTENEEDIEALINLAQKMKDQIKKDGGNFDITLSASTFIPKAHTPFELMKREDKKSLENKVNYLKKTFHKMGIDFRTPSIEWDIVQTNLSIHQESLADFLIEVVENGGNLGAFKQLWRKKEKSEKGTLSANASKIPIDNIKTPVWDKIVENNSFALKSKRQKELSELLN